MEYYRIIFWKDKVEQTKNERKNVEAGKSCWGN
jgi:hypothetical protein